MSASIMNNKIARVALAAALGLAGIDNFKTNVFFVAANSDSSTTSTAAPTDDAVNVTSTTTAVPCTNVTTAVNATMTNATDNSTYYEMVDTTECVANTVNLGLSGDDAEEETVAKTKVLGRLTVGFSVPADTTAAALNSDAAFRGAMAATIKAALSLGDSAAVTVPFLKVPGEADPDTTAVVATTAVAATPERRLSAAIFRRVLNTEAESTEESESNTENSESESAAANTLELEIAYEIELPESEAAAVYTLIADKATFEAAVKTESAAALTAAGFTGYAVDTVAAADATGDLAPAADEEDASTSGAFSSFGKTAGSFTPLFVAVVGMKFSLSQLM